MLLLGLLLLSGPTVELRLSPAMALWQHRLVTVTAIVEVVDPEHKLYCPEIEWTWDDGSRSVHQEDCDPEGTTAEDFIYSKEHYYKGPGQYLVSVTLKSSTTTRKQTSPLEIR